MYTEPHFKTTVKGRLVGHLLQSELLQLQRIDCDGREAYQPEFWFPDGQVVYRVLMPRTNESGILKLLFF